MPSEVERLRSGMRVLSTAIAAFAEATIEYRRLLDTVVRQIADVVPDSCVILLRDGDDLIAGAIYDRDPKILEELVVLYAQPLGPAAVQTHATMTSGKPRLIPSLDLEQMRPHITQEMYETFSSIGLRGVLLVPMRVQGEPFGVMTVLRHRDYHRALDELDLELVSDLANHAAIAIANARHLHALRENDDLRRAKEELSSANRFLDAIIENIPDMVFVKDADRLAFTRFNRAGEELIGASRDALIGKNDYDLFPPEEAMHFQAMDKQTLRGKTLVEIEEPIQTATGKRWLRTKKVPILDEHGEPAYLLGISQDVTEQKLHHAALVHAMEKAETANRELESFSYSVAHDLRAPLRGVDGFSQALLEDYGDRLDDEGRHLLHRVRDQAQRMATLIDDLLALSRVTRHTLVREVVDLGALARTSLAACQRLEPERSVRITVGQGMSVEADPRMMAIAFDNLLGNAWKFTSKSPDAHIEIGHVLVDGEQRYFVRDNGAGFDPKYTHKLFGVFQRLHTEREFPGTGIGLATVARIILRHRGRVWAEGEPGKGATFFFTLGEPETP